MSNAVVCNRTTRHRWACRAGMPGASRCDLLEHHEDFAFEFLDVGLDDLQRARRLVTVEVAVEWDFVSNLSLGGVNPRVGHVGEHLALEVFFDALLERHSLG